MRCAPSSPASGQALTPQCALAVFAARMSLHHRALQDGRACLEGCCRDDDVNSTIPSAARVRLRELAWEIIVFSSVP
eukprot:7126975-Pyramimonas_sp.AAC.1